MSELIAEGLRLLQNSFAEYGYWFVLLALFLENVMFLGTVIPGAVVQYCIAVSNAAGGASAAVIGGTS